MKKMNEPRKFFIKVFWHDLLPEDKYYAIGIPWKILNGQSTILINKNIDWTFYALSIDVMLASMAFLWGTTATMILVGFLALVFLVCISRIANYIKYGMILNKSRTAFQKLSIKDQRQLTKGMLKFADELALQLEIDRRNKKD